MSTREAVSSRAGSANSKPRVYVVDDDESFRTAITRLLRAAGYEAIGFASAGEFLLVPRADGFGCILLDVQMPGPSGLELQEALARSGPALPIIFISGQGSIQETVRAMKAGAADFLTKPVDRDVLLQTIEGALSRGMAVRAQSNELRMVQGLYETLSPREREVFKGIVGGKLNKEVANELGTTERTVKAQRASVMAKMKVNSFAELVRIGCLLQATATSPAPHRPSA